MERWDNVLVHTADVWTRHASNYDANATCDDGSCIAWIPGCTNPNSTNYNPSATQDDGSCIANVVGCQDTNAYNYNPAANRPCGWTSGGSQSFSGYSNFNERGFGGYQDKMWFND